MIVYPNADGSHGEATVDSSPQIMRLEGEYDGRRVVPTDPALAFIDGLLEDFGDEWLTKAMYHYRWAYDDDIDKAGHLLPTSRRLSTWTAIRAQADVRLHHAAPDRPARARGVDRPQRADHRSDPMSGCSTR